MAKKHASRIVVVGAGKVGSSIVFAAMMRGIAAEIVIVDIDEVREEGEVMDLSNGLIGSEIGRLRGGDYRDCQEADVIVITAGAAQKPGETRLDLTKTNVRIFRDILSNFPTLRDDCVVLVVSNPVDILTTIAKVESRLPEQQVFGSGTSLDTARMRAFVGEKLKVNVHSVEGFVMGEHGDSEFVAWSSVSVGGVAVSKLLSLRDRKEIEEKTSHAAYEIIKRKQATNYGIAAVTCELLEAVLHDKRSVMAVSSTPGTAYGIHDVCVGIPAVIGRSGVEKVWCLELLPQEKKALSHSAEVLTGILKNL